ncbi:MAG: hypothetical protein V4598_07095 [Bdellovibrionota bacterium]
MKTFIIMGLTLSLSAFAQTRSTDQGSGYAPNNGTAQPGNPGTYTTPNAGLGNAAPTTTGTGTDINGAGTMGSGTSDANAEATETLERSNTSATPIPTDTTLQTGKTKGMKQSQEAEKEELDMRTRQGVDHNEQNASENQ